jgi:hypothetical protein
MSTQKNISRRNFLKNAAVAGAAFTIVPRFVLGGKGYIPPSDTLYIAGIGVGGKGTSDLKGFAANPKAKIAFLHFYATLMIGWPWNQKRIFLTRNITKISA